MASASKCGVDDALARHSWLEMRDRAATMKNSDDPQIGAAHVTEGGQKHGYRVAIAGGDSS
jgi:hypothetical protein